jgi:predicted PhzF superfamily epimerase YddE/YHI9
MNDSFIKIEQGDILDRKGRVEVKFNNSKNELTIAGNAITILKGKLNF